MTREDKSRTESDGDPSTHSVWVAAAVEEE